MTSSTDKLDKKLAAIVGNTFVEMPLETLQALVALTVPDETQSERVWNSIAVAESLGQFGQLHKQQTGYVYVDRGRGLKESRHETQGILTGGEASAVPNDKVTLFLLRTTPKGTRRAAWWPQIRFPDGRYAFAFAV